MTLRVVGWSTGTVGRHAIAGIDARPELELVGLWVSNPDKVGKDAGELAGLGRELGVAATNDKEALLALQPDGIVHTAMTDDRVFEAIDDLVMFLERGVNVVSSGPVVLQYPHGILPPYLVARVHEVDGAARVAGGDHPVGSRHGHEIFRADDAADEADVAVRLAAGLQGRRFRRQDTEQEDRQQRRQPPRPAGSVKWWSGHGVGV